MAIFWCFGGLSRLQNVVYKCHPVGPVFPLMLVQSLKVRRLIVPPLVAVDLEFRSKPDAFAVAVLLETGLFGQPGVEALRG